MSDHKMLYTRQQIADRVATLGRQITQDYTGILKPDEQLLTVGVLNGAFIFMADLVREIDLPVEVDFIRLSSYQKASTSSSQVVMTKNLEKDIKDRHLLIVEDIADCGLTLAWLLDFLKKRQPASIRVAVAIDKRARRETFVDLDYICFSMDDGFLVGYGLDYAEKFRTLKDIFEVVTTD